MELIEFIRKEIQNQLSEDDVVFTKDEMEKLHKDGEVVKVDSDGEEHNYTYKEESVNEAKGDIKIERLLAFGKYQTVKHNFKNLKQAFDFVDKSIKRVMKKNKKVEKDLRPGAYGKQQEPTYKINGKYYQSKYSNVDFSKHVPKNQIISRADESVNEIKLSADEKQKLDKAISVTDKVKAGKARKDAITYIVKLAKEKTGEYPRTLKQALYFLDYLDESVNEAIKKGDFVKNFFTREIGVVNKVRGRMVYVKFPSTGEKSFEPMSLTNLTPSSEKHKGKPLYIEESVNEAKTEKHFEVGTPAVFGKTSGEVVLNPKTQDAWTPRGWVDVKKGVKGIVSYDGKRFFVPDWSKTKSFNESVNEYIGDDIHDSSPLHFGRNSKLGGQLYNRLKAKLGRRYGPNKFRVAGNVAMLGNRRLFNLRGSLSLNDIFYKILSMERQLGLKVNEQYYDSLKKPKFTEKVKKESQITETLKITKQRTDYVTGPDFTVYEVDGVPQFDIQVNSSAVWSTDPHDKRGRKLRLMDAGTRRATIYFKEGNLKVLAKQMHDLTSETTWGEKRGLTPDDYYKVLTMWVDMSLHESTNEETKRDYKKEYAKYGKSEKAKKYRAELNKYNRDKGTYGNGDGKDASHKGGKIVGFEAESKNRGRREKSRLKKESVNYKVIDKKSPFYGKKLKYVAVGHIKTMGDSVILQTDSNGASKIFHHDDIKKESVKEDKNMKQRKHKESVNEELPTAQIDPSEFPNPLPSNKKGFLKKGNYDGDKTDDIVKTKPVSISVSQLKPSQDAIYLGKSLGMAVAGIEGGDLGAVISKDNYILDGHHRYAGTTFNNPSAKVGGVQSDLVIGDLVPVLRAVGDAMKNQRGVEPSGGDINIFKATMDDVKACIYDGKNMDSKFYNKEKSIAWFEKIGEKTIAKRLKMIQSKRPPSGAPGRKDMPKIHPNQLGILKTLLNKGNIDVKKPYTESVNEAMSKDAKFKIYDKLKKGDKITIKFDDAIRRGTETTFVVSKGKTKVGKAKVERIILKNVKNPKGVKYYLYQRDGSVSLAVGDMAASIVDMSESTNEQGLTFHKSAFGESVNEEQLDEKLITFSNRAPYGQIVFMAGGAASGKGFAVSNFLDSSSFKVRDVDEMKKALGRLDKLGKISVDSWYKKYGDKLKTEPREAGTLSEKEHIQKFVLNKGMSISDISADLRNPNNVASLHYIIDSMKLKDRWLFNMLKGKSNKETLPNLLFDMTAKNPKAIKELINPLVSAGYDTKNIHLIWVLNKYTLAIKQNKKRPRVVPEDILLQTHEGAAETIWSVLTKALPKGINGRIDVILNNRKNTVMWRVGDTNKTQRRKNTKGDVIKARPIKSDPDQEFVVRGFVSLPVKKQGGAIVPESRWKIILHSWIMKNAPKTIDLNKPLKEQMKSVNEAEEPDVITQLRDIVSSSQNKKIKDPKTGKKMRVDLYSASAVTQVYDALKQQSNKDKFTTLGLVGMVNMAFKLMKKESVTEAKKTKGSGKITKSSGWYTASFKNYGGHTISKDFRTEEEAQKFLDKHLKNESVNEASDSMLQFVRDEASGGMIASATGMTKYKDIDKIRGLMIHMLQKKDVKYSLDNFKKLAKTVSKFMSGKRESVN